MFVQEIPPVGRSGKHVHLNEEIHYIVKGQGYDIHDGQRFDWKEGDVVCIPILTEHQHFNADPNNPAKFVAIETRWHQYAGYGGILQLEDAPAWRSSQA